MIKLWSRKLDILPSKLLIPLSYAGVMGGPLAAIATPTTLLLCGMYDMVLLTVTGVMPLLQSAFLAAGAMLVFGCCTPSQAMNSINWNILISLGGGIVMGTALQKTGLANQMAEGVLALCGSHPIIVMIALCLMAAFVTEFVSNSAAIALMFPVVYDAAMGIGCNPLPFAIALLLAVNAAFLTPISTPPQSVGVRSGGLPRNGLSAHRTSSKTGLSD